MGARYDPLIILFSIYLYLCKTMKEIFKHIIIICLHVCVVISVQNNTVLQNVYSICKNRFTIVVSHPMRTVIVARPRIGVKTFLSKVSI